MPFAVPTEPSLRRCLANALIAAGMISSAPSLETSAAGGDVLHSKQTEQPLLNLVKLSVHRCAFAWVDGCAPCLHRYWNMS